MTGDQGKPRSRLKRRSATNQQGRQLRLSPCQSQEPWHRLFSLVKNSLLEKSKRQSLHLVPKQGQVAKRSSAAPTLPATQKVDGQEAAASRLTSSQTAAQKQPAVAQEPTSTKHTASKQVVVDDWAETLDDSDSEAFKPEPVDWMTVGRKGRAMGENFKADAVEAAASKKTTATGTQAGGPSKPQAKPLVFNKKYQHMNIETPCCAVVLGPDPRLCLGDKDRQCRLAHRVEYLTDEQHDELKNALKGITHGKKSFLDFFHAQVDKAKAADVAIANRRNVREEQRREPHRQIGSNHLANTQHKRGTAAVSKDDSTKVNNPNLHRGPREGFLPPLPSPPAT